jgi:hypothetical protein
MRRSSSPVILVIAALVVGPAGLPGARGFEDTVDTAGDLSDRAGF